jgi:hypothetical protein
MVMATHIVCPMTACKHNGNLNGTATEGYCTKEEIELTPGCNYYNMTCSDFEAGGGNE